MNHPSDLKFDHIAFDTAMRDWAKQTGFKLIFPDHDDRDTEYSFGDLDDRCIYSVWEVENGYAGEYVTYRPYQRSGEFRSDDPVGLLNKMKDLSH